MHLPILTNESAPTESLPVLDGIAADLGFVPNMAATMAASPTLLAAFDGLRRAVGAAPLDPVHREVAGLAVGVAADNAYGVAFHSTVLGRLGVADDDIDRMRDGQPPSDPRAAAVYDLAQAIVLERGKVDDALLDRATGQGFTPAAVLEIVTECTFAGLVGTVDNLAGRVELDAFLAPRAWSGEPSIQRS
jgi:alkylhydroperoxidase family enzyme